MSTNSHASRLLIVDDDAVLRQLMSTLLRRQGIGWEFRQFPDGADLLQYLRQEIPDRQSADNIRAILLDLQMPEIDGIGVLKAVKTEPCWADIPVIMLTSSDDPLDRQQCLALGCEDYHYKPRWREEFRTLAGRLATQLRNLHSDGVAH